MDEKCLKKSIDSKTKIDGVEEEKNSEKLNINTYLKDFKEEKNKIDRKALSEDFDSSIIESAILGELREEDQKKEEIKEREEKK